MSARELGDQATRFVGQALAVQDLNPAALKLNQPFRLQLSKNGRDGLTRDSDQARQLLMRQGEPDFAAVTLGLTVRLHQLEKHANHSFPAGQEQQIAESILNSPSPPTDQLRDRQH
jgi:hypothetical protein